MLIYYTTTLLYAHLHFVARHSLKLTARARTLLPSGSDTPVCVFCLLITVAIGSHFSASASMRGGMETDSSPE